MSEKVNVLVVDDMPLERAAILSRLEGACKRHVPGSEHLLECHQMGDDPDDLTMLTESLRRGETPYHFILCDVFMPLPGENMPSPKGGWRRLFEALRDRYKKRPPRPAGDIYLVGMTHRPEPDLKLELHRLIKDATGECGRQWACLFPKPGLDEIQRPPEGADRLIDEYVWFPYLRHALRLLLEGKDLDQWLGEAAADVIAESSLMQEAVMRVSLLAKTTWRTIAIIGETGTGKEVMARRYHAKRRAKGDFLAVNINNIDPGVLVSELFGATRGAFTGAVEAEGKFRENSDDTVFLDEVGTDPKATAELKTKLLRLLGEGTFSRVGDKDRLERKFEGRIVLAGSGLEQDLADSSNDILGRVPPDAWMKLPPLRERLHEVRPLFEKLLERRGGKRVWDRLSIHEDVWPFLCELPWKRNVRDLENVAGWVVEVFDLPELTRRALETGCKTIGAQLAERRQEPTALPSRTLTAAGIYQEAMKYAEECHRDKQEPNKDGLAKLLGCHARTIRNHAKHTVPSTGRTLDEELKALGFSEGGRPKESRNRSS